MKLFRSPCLFLAASFGLAGCGDSIIPTPEPVECEVVVTINGQPLPNAMVTLTPTERYSGTAIATGVTDETGRAKLMCCGKAGACPGKNSVTVTDPPGSEESRGESAQAQMKATAEAVGLKNRPIPAQYGLLGKSGLSVDVKKDQKEHKVELKR
jgi:hypothetical protein